MTRPLLPLAAVDGSGETGAAGAHAAIAATGGGEAADTGVVLGPCGHRVCRPCGIEIVRAGMSINREHDFPRCDLCVSARGVVGSRTQYGVGWLAYAAVSSLVAWSNSVDAATRDGHEPLSAVMESRYDRAMVLAALVDRPAGEVDAAAAAGGAGGGAGGAGGAGGRRAPVVFAAVAAAAAAAAPRVAGDAVPDDIDVAAIAALFAVAERDAAIAAVAAAELGGGGGGGAAGGGAAAAGAADADAEALPPDAPAAPPAVRRQGSVAGTCPNPDLWANMKATPTPSPVRGEGAAWGPGLCLAGRLARGMRSHYSGLSHSGVPCEVYASVVTSGAASTTTDREGLELEVAREGGIVGGLGKPCPVCAIMTMHYRGHGCHHAQPGGCIMCGTHYCWVCLGPWPCTNGCPTYCTPACGCPECPDCRPGAKCAHCPGAISCPSCQEESAEDAAERRAGEAAAQAAAIAGGWVGPRLELASDARLDMQLRLAGFHTTAASLWSHINATWTALGDVLDSTAEAVSAGYALLLLPAASDAAAAAAPPPTPEALAALAAAVAVPPPRVALIHERACAIDYALRTAARIIVTEGRSEWGYMQRAVTNVISSLAWFIAQPTFVAPGPTSSAVRATLLTIVERLGAVLLAAACREHDGMFSEMVAATLMLLAEAAPAALAPATRDLDREAALRAIGSLLAVVHQMGCAAPYTFHTVMQRCIVSPDSINTLRRTGLAAAVPYYVPLPALVQVLLRMAAADAEALMGAAPSTPAGGGGAAAAAAAATAGAAVAGGDAWYPPGRLASGDVTPLVARRCVVQPATASAAALLAMMAAWQPDDDARLKVLSGLEATVPSLLVLARYYSTPGAGASPDGTPAAGLPSVLAALWAARDLPYYEEGAASRAPPPRTPAAIVAAVALDEAALAPAAVPPALRRALAVVACMPLLRPSLPEEARMRRSRWVTSTSSIVADASLWMNTASALMAFIGATGVDDLQMQLSLMLSREAPVAPASGSAARGRTAVVAPSPPPVAHFTLAVANAVGGVGEELLALVALPHGTAAADLPPAVATSRAILAAFRGAQAVAAAIARWPAAGAPTEGVLTLWAVAAALLPATICRAAAAVPGLPKYAQAVMRGCAENLAPLCRDEDADHDISTDASEALDAVAGAAVHLLRTHGTGATEEARGVVRRVATDLAAAVEVRDGREAWLGVPPAAALALALDAAGGGDAPALVAACVASAVRAVDWGTVQALGRLLDGVLLACPAALGEAQRQAEFGDMVNRGSVLAELLDARARTFATAFLTAPIAPAPGAAPGAAAAVAAGTAAAAEAAAAAAAAPAALAGGGRGGAPHVSMELAELLAASLTTLVDTPRAMRSLCRATATLCAVEGDLAARLGAMPAVVNGVLAAVRAAVGADLETYLPTGRLLAFLMHAADDAVGVVLAREGEVHTLVSHLREYVSVATSTARAIDCAAVVYTMLSAIAQRPAGLAALRADADFMPVVHRLEWNKVPHSWLVVLEHHCALLAHLVGGAADSRDALLRDAGGSVLQNGFRWGLVSPGSLSPGAIKAALQVLCAVAAVAPKAAASPAHAGAVVASLAAALRGSAASAAVDPAIITAVAAAVATAPLAGAIGGLWAPGTKAPRMEPVRPLAGHGPGGPPPPPRPPRPRLEGAAGRHRRSARKGAAVERRAVRRPVRCLR